MPLPGFVHSLHARFDMPCRRTSSYGSIIPFALYCLRQVTLAAFVNKM